MVGKYQRKDIWNTDSGRVPSVISTVKLSMILRLFANPPISYTLYGHLGSVSFNLYFSKAMKFFILLVIATRYIKDV